MFKDEGAGATRGRRHRAGRGVCQAGTEWARLPYDLLGRISNRIISRGNEDANRVPRRV